MFGRISIPQNFMRFVQIDKLHCFVFKYFFFFVIMYKYKTNSVILLVVILNYDITHILFH